MELYKHQEEALDKLSSGSILVGDTGSGKSLTSLAFYNKFYSDMDLYIITPANKRDKKEWLVELKALNLSAVAIDSWHSIEKYKQVSNAFFIFDEQKTINYGKWSKMFIEIAKNNKWIMLSATPAEKWENLAAVFIANGYYKNISDFRNRHIIYDPYVTMYPKVKGYVDEPYLNKLSDKILVRMLDPRTTVRKKYKVHTEYDKKLYSTLTDTLFNPETQEPIKTASEYTQLIRRVVNTNESKIKKLHQTYKAHSKLIVFYFYNYELDILREYANDNSINYSEWNGQKHEPICDTDSWLYLVQYTSGSESWNCIETDAMLFYSLSYSNREMEQCMGRIDRINTTYPTLHYYMLVSDAPIDHNILRAIESKKTFSEALYFDKIVKAKDKHTSNKFSVKYNISESTFQAKLKKFLENKYPEITIMKSDPSIIQGFPDLILMYKNKYALLEVKKSKTASKRPNQEYYVEKFKQHTYSEFVYPENVNEIIEELDIFLRGETHVE